MAREIPVIDNEEIKEKYEDIREASKKWGCFRVVNHGIPTELMGEMKEVSKELFERPRDIKERNKDVIPGSGYMSPSLKNPLYEAFGLFDCSSPSVVSDFCSHLLASSHQREIIELYAKEISNLAKDIASKLATSLDLTDSSFEGWPLQFRINKYSFAQETLGSPGVQLHTDSGFLTILQEDENHGGLEVMDPSGEFVAVDPVPSTFLVNMGDVAVPWSNGLLRNLQHRVQCKDVGTRISIATFLSPPPDQIIEADPKLIAADHPPMFRPFTYAELRNIRASQKMHVGEALDRLR